MMSEPAEMTLVTPVAVALPLFVTTKSWVVLVELPTDTLPKSFVVGEIVSVGDAVPDRATTTSLVPPAENVSVAVRAPLVAPVGLKRTVCVHEAPAATGVVQLLVTIENWFVDDVPAPIVTADVPGLVIVTVCAALVVSRGEEKVSVVGEAVMFAGVPAVPVTVMVWVSTVLEPRSVAFTVTVAVLAPAVVAVNTRSNVQLLPAVAGVPVQVFAEMANSEALAPPITTAIGPKSTEPLLSTVKVLAVEGVPTETAPNSPGEGVTCSGPTAVPVRVAMAVVPPVPVTTNVPAFAGGVRSSGENFTPWVQTNQVPGSVADTAA